jgi:hypothetical protein
MLPIFKDDNQSFMQMQNNWAAQLNPVLNSPSITPTILQNVNLTTGSNTINHKLGRKLQGWKITRQRAAASIHDDQDANQMPALTLVLVSDAPVSIDLEVF